MSTQPVPQIHFFKSMDKDGFDWCFARQEYTNSCGPACVRNAKQLVHNQLLDEGKTRQQISSVELLNPMARDEKQDYLRRAEQLLTQPQVVQKLASERLAKDKARKEAGLAEKGELTRLQSVKKALKIVLTPPDRSSAHLTRGANPWVGDASWHNMATRPECVVEALHSEPLAVPTAKMVSNKFREHLLATTRDHPAILAVMWMFKHEGNPTSANKQSVREKKSGSTGGHFVVCAGPTADRKHFIVLDPMNGLRYIDCDDVTDTCILYDSGFGPAGHGPGNIGKVDVDIQKNAKATVVDEQLVPYVARGRLSKCCVIVTHSQTV